MEENTYCDQQEQPSCAPATQLKRRGRPKLNVAWPESDFTFNALEQNNSMLSSSSLRKKMRVELVKGGLVKVGTLKTAFGRPQNIYKKS
tara:strand:+ start:1389 stop:1655 length:267 start_codon:yes stop_codon:yes gene_type:complete